MRRRRQWLAALLLFVLSFAQAVTAAHACPIPNFSAKAASEIASATDAMPSDCAGMAKRAGLSANACESHCLADLQVTAPADAPLPPAAPQPPLSIRVAAPLVAMPAPFSEPWPIGAMPPPLLRFGRLLI